MFGNLFGRNLRAKNGKCLTAKETLQNRIANVVNREPPRVTPEVEQRRVEVEYWNGSSITSRPAGIDDPVLTEEELPVVVNAEPVEEFEAVTEDSDQPRIIRRVYLSTKVMNSGEPHDAVRLNSQITGYLLDELHYHPRELNAEAYMAHAVHLYVQTILNEGHEAFVANTGNSDEFWQAVRDGLTEINADDHLTVFRELGQVLSDDPGLGDRVASGAPSREDIRILEELDNKLLSADGSKSAFALLGKWLRSRTDIRVFEPEDLDHAVNELASQPAVLVRHEEFLAAERENKRQDPINRIGMAIAELAGLEFERWGSRIDEFEADGQVMEEGRLLISNGEPAVMVRSGEGRYTLYDHESGRELASLDLEGVWELSAA